MLSKFSTEGLRGFVLNAGGYIPTPAGRRSRAHWGSGWHRSEESPHTRPPAAAGLQECLPFHYCSETNRHFRVMHRTKQNSKINIRWNAKVPNVYSSQANEFIKPFKMVLLCQWADPHKIGTHKSSADIRPSFTVLQYISPITSMFISISLPNHFDQFAFSAVCLKHLPFKCLKKNFWFPYFLLEEAHGKCNAIWELYWTKICICLFGKVQPSVFIATSSLKRKALNINVYSVSTESLSILAYR